MEDLLSKPDAAHQRQLALEVKARTTMRVIWSLYGIGGVLTLAFQLYTRFAQCDGVLNCGVGTFKSLIWMVLWPFYWMFYTNGFG